MKANNQLGILKMVSADFNEDCYSSRIITDENSKDLVLEITRDFIWRTTVRYTPNDIIRISLENDGNVFDAVLNDISKAFSNRNHENYTRRASNV